MSIMIKYTKQSLVRLAEYIEGKKKTWVFFLMLITYKLLAKIVILFKDTANILKINNW